MVIVIYSLKVLQSYCFFVKYATIDYFLIENCRMFAQFKKNHYLCEKFCLMRESEYHIISSLDFAESSQPSVIILHKSGIRLSAGDHIVGKRYRKWRLREFRAICELTHEQMVARIKRALHRG